MNPVIRAISPLDKPRLTDSITSFEPFISASVMGGESFAFHVAVTDPSAAFLKRKCRLHVSVQSDDGHAEDGVIVRMYAIEHVPVRTAAYPDAFDDDYISTQPGLYPDLLVPLTENSEVYLPQAQTGCFRIEVDSVNMLPGKHLISAVFCDYDDGKEVCRTEAIMHRLADELPPQQTIVMHWLHADCLADYYGVDILSWEHFRILENYIRCAVQNGVNAVYTPLFTPPLDTEIGGERPTVQLIDVTRSETGWRFGFDRLDEFIRIALDCGVKYFELSHLFTQWGAHHAPKIMVRTDSGLVRQFGWDTDASASGYKQFLSAFLPELRSHMMSLGLDDKCIYHISDEPDLKDIDSYRSAVETVGEYLNGCIIADALSHRQFYDEGLCSCPIAATNTAENFLPAIPQGLWVYYCCAQNVNVSNRFIAVPLGRVRVIGVQMWKARCTGFLHWGYNFWSSQFSTHKVNPFRCSDGEYFVPAGDAFSVYPGDDGTALMSVRLRTFHEALCDIRALSFSEKKYGRTAVEAIVDDVFGKELSFTCYPHGDTGERILTLRRRLAEM